MHPSHPPPNQQPKKKTAQVFFLRLLLVVAGLYMVTSGVLTVKQGVFAFQNRYGQSSFPSGTIALGVVFILLALIPNGDWFYRRITTKPISLDEQLRRARLNHPSHHGQKKSVEPGAEDLPPNLDEER
jgi:hypothetical protein